MILPCLCDKRLSQGLSPSSESSSCRRRKWNKRAGDDGGTPLPVVHNALAKTQAESLRRGECNRLVLSLLRVFEFPHLLPIMIREKKGNTTALKTIFNAVEVIKWYISHFWNRLQPTRFPITKAGTRSFKQATAVQTYRCQGTKSWNTKPRA